MSDERDDLTPDERAALRAHNPPPPFPAESVWSAIQRRQRPTLPVRGYRRRVLLSLAASIALCLAGGAGYALGRQHAEREATPGRQPDVARAGTDSTVTVTWF